jgi:hypothetical protein
MKSALSRSGFRTFPEGPGIEDILVATAARPQSVDSDETLEERQQQMPIPNELEVVTPNSRRILSSSVNTALLVKQQRVGLGRSRRSQARCEGESNAEQFPPRIVFPGIIANKQRRIARHFKKRMDPTIKTEKGRNGGSPTHGKQYFLTTVATRIFRKLN